MTSTSAITLYISTFLSLAFASSNLLIDPLSKDNSPQCQCYLTSGPDPGYFQYHRFWDFRNIPNDGPNDYTAAPAILTDSQNNGDEPITSSFFNTSSFLADWAIQTGQQGRNSAVPTFNSAQNVYISRNSTDNPPSSTYLTLRVHRLENFTSIAEIDSNQKNILHSSIRVRARIIPNGLSNSSAPSSGDTDLTYEPSGSNASRPVDQGAVWGFFTYHNDNQESDIEVLTKDPINQIHYSNQPDFNYKTNDVIPDASTQVTLPNGLVWTDWLDHRIDWFDGIARWYVNDQLVETKSKNAETDHSGLIVNLWSDGGEWSGNMSVGSGVTVGIQWIDMVFNVSGSVDGKGNHKMKRDDDGVGLWKRKENLCQIGCSVDGLQDVGTPLVAYNVSSGGVSFLRRGGSGDLVVVMFGVALLTALFVLVV